jgi:hypothetical protein
MMHVAFGMGTRRQAFEVHRRPASPLAITSHSQLLYGLLVYWSGARLVGPT